jgi:hypothetical protein
MEVFAAVYRAELKSFGIDVVVAAAGNMRTGGPAKTASALARVTDGMTPDQRALYGQAFDTFASRLNSMQGSGLDAASAARRVIEIAEEVPAPAVPRSAPMRRRCSGPLEPDPTWNSTHCASRLLASRRVAERGADFESRSGDSAYKGLKLCSSKHGE